MIRSREEYDFVKSQGFEPLVNKMFRLDINLRHDIQTEMFGNDNEKFYRWCWNHYPHFCCECMRKLDHYSATYVSHVITRGSSPEMAHDPRNVMILCAAHHEQYEHRTTRRNMRIFPTSERIISELREDYNDFY